MIQFDDHIFQMGENNRQLGKCLDVKKDNDQVIQAKWPVSWFPAYMDITNTNLFRVEFQLIRITLKACDFLLYHTWVYWDIGIYDYGLLWFMEEKRMHEFHRQPCTEWTSNGWHK